MMVAVSLFAVVMTISVGALLSLVDANRKAQALQSVMNNLNVALDGMVRSIRMGTVYHCDSTSQYNMSVLSSRGNCTDGGELIAFESFNGSSNENDDQWVYWHEDGRLYKSTDTRDSALPVTAPEVQIDSFAVYVTGAEGTLNENGNTEQPKVIIVIQGTAGSGENAFGVIGNRERIRTTFNIQAVASQRLLDI
jgi:type II secretory pathway pseudopilin PulG